MATSSRESTTAHDSRRISWLEMHTSFLVGKLVPVDRLPSSPLVFAASFVLMMLAYRCIPWGILVGLSLGLQNGSVKLFPKNGNLIEIQMIDSIAHPKAYIWGTCISIGTYIAPLIIHWTLFGTVDLDKLFVLASPLLLSRHIVLLCSLYIPMYWPPMTIFMFATIYFMSVICGMYYLSLRWMAWGLSDAQKGKPVDRVEMWFIQLYSAIVSLQPLYELVIFAAIEGYSLYSNS